MLTLTHHKKSVRAMALHPTEYVLGHFISYFMKAKEPCLLVLYLNYV